MHRPAGHRHCFRHRRPCGFNNSIDLQNITIFWGTCPTDLLWGLCGCTPQRGTSVPNPNIQPQTSCRTSLPESRTRPRKMVEFIAEVNKQARALSCAQLMSRCQWQCRTNISRILSCRYSREQQLCNCSDGRPCCSETAGDFPTSISRAVSLSFVSAN